MTNEGFLIAFLVVSWSAHCVGEPTAPASTARSDGRSSREYLVTGVSVIYGTSLGNGNSHANGNVPVLIAGGGFRHAQHLALGGNSDYPLPKLVCQRPAAPRYRNGLLRKQYWNHPRTSDLIDECFC